MIFFILLLTLARHICAQYAGVSGLFFGPAYTVTPRSGAAIVEYSTILRVPKVPNFSKGLLVIWPGINTPGDPTNLVQSCIGVGGAKAFCRAARVAADQWCAFTSTNMGASPRARYAGQQRAGAGVSINAGKDLHITYKYNDQTQQFTQTLAVDGRVVSSRSDKVGKGARFNTAVEGQGAFKGTLYSHTYSNNTFRFSSAYQGFPSSVRKGKGITASTPVSKDGGKTWTIDQIVIPDYKRG